MTHKLRRSSPRPRVPGQYSLGLVPEPMRADGYCSRCNRDYVDIIRHRTSDNHRQRSYVSPGPLPKGRPGWMLAIRANPNEQYADEERRLRERQSGAYPTVGIAPMIGDIEP